MNTKPYEYLIAIAEKANISRATATLHVSQPTLSNFLTGTENQLGHKLFERSGKLLIPTEAGSIYLETCRNILDVKNRTYQAITHLGNKCSETIRVGLTPYRGSQVFSTIYPSFYQKFPDAKVELSEGYTTAMKAGVLDGSLDLALGTLMPGETGDFGFSTQSSEELLLAVPTHHPLADRGSESGSFCPVIDIHEFNDTPFVFWGPQTTNRVLVDDFFQRNHMTPTIVYESNNALLVDGMMKNGIGAGFLPAAFCKPGLNRVYFSVRPSLRTLVGIFYRNDHILTRAQRYFIYLVSLLQLKTGTNGQTYFNETANRIIEEFED
ncbi:MAG: LysR family transcriptional regulator [Eubacteriales bacterium]|nr:LysR family transcriptional regulator [Eubacteriales bacterium]